MDAAHLIAAIRDSHQPERAEFNWFAAGLADGRVSDAQAGAFAMAVLLQGLGEEGRVALTLAMRDSGRVLSWALDGPILDKHSTGGVGDCVSLVLAPALAACGAYVPMVSGRGLGHTGGTLDKMESIPGVSTTLSEAQFRALVARAGCAIVSASADIAPADKRLYAIRDVTATVASLDLITASILSKKLAVGLEGLVLDVKFGSGAFMKTLPEAEALAATLVSTANMAGCPTRALISDMSHPLAPAIGNGLEVACAMEVLCEGKGGRLAELSTALGGTVLAAAGLAGDESTGEDMIRAVIADGRAAERFAAMIAAMGGPLRFIEDWPRFLPEAPVIQEVAAKHDGYVAAMDGEALGRIVGALGAGRQREGDVIDPAVGLSQILPLGSRVSRGQPLLHLHAAREDGAQAALKALETAITIEKTAPKVTPLVCKRIKG